MSYSVSLRYHSYSLRYPLWSLSTTGWFGKISTDIINLLVQISLSYGRLTYLVAILIKRLAQTTVVLICILYKAEKRIQIHSAHKFTPAQCRSNLRSSKIAIHFIAT